MIKAVIFDCFGVLAADGWKHLREEFWGNDPENMRRAHDMDKAVNAGFMKYDDFVTEICDMTGLDKNDVLHRINGTSPNKVLFDYIGMELKPTVKIGMLSNAASDWLNELFENEQVELFDAVVLSYQIGAVKPEQIMYQTIVDRLGVQPNKCIFIDDSESFCAAAQKLGMKSIWHQDTYDTIAKIKEMLHA